MRWRGERQRLKQRFGAPGHFAQAIGQMAPDSFTHGISQQRMRWFTRGIESGDARQCDTFSARTLQGLLRP